MRSVFIVILLFYACAVWAQGKLSGTYNLAGGWEFGETYTFENDSTFTYTFHGCSPNGSVGKGVYCFNQDTLTLHYLPIKDTSFSFSYKGYYDSTLKQQTIYIHSYKHDTLDLVLGEIYDLADSDGHRYNKGVAIDSYKTFVIKLPDSVYNATEEICNWNIFFKRTYCLPFYHNEYNRHEYNLIVYNDDGPEYMKPKTETYIVWGLTSDMFYTKEKDYDCMYLKKDVAKEQMTPERIMATKEYDRVISKYVRKHKANRKKGC